MAELEFRLLGAVEACRDGSPVFLGPARLRSVLAVLLLAGGNPVSLDEFVERVWGDASPRQARSSLHSYFTRLRYAFDLVRRGHGYALEIDPETVDVHRFRRLIRAEDLDGALALWRGEPLAGLESPWLDRIRADLLAEREAALLDHADRKLELGQHGELLPDLMARAERNMLDERLAGQLMLALHRSGRQADALLHFEKVKGMLAEELGVDPGPALRSVHQSLLQNDIFVPRQLAAAPRTFAGRRDELKVLSEMPPLSVIVGPGGIGKTTLALQWAHEHVDRFPDGQLFADLAAVEPADAMRNFLLALGVSPAVIPEDQAAMTGLYRSVLAAKRALIVLDNAIGAEQVSALLPGGASCAVVATSRNRLTSLVSQHNAVLLSLDVLAVDDAYSLLVSRLGVDRAEAEPHAVEELLAACGGLPLALTITVGRAQEHPDFPLAALAAELKDAGLNAFEVDTELGVRAVLSTSYAALSAAQADVFALLGLVPGPDVGLEGVAALAGQTFASVRTILRALERGSLIQQHSPGRFRMHDLVRSYAREQAGERFPAETRDAALRRLVDFYLHTLVIAAHRVDTGRPMITMPPPARGCVPLALRDEDESRLWFDLEAENIAAARRLAEQRLCHRSVWQFAWALSNFNAYAGNMRDELAGWHSALAAVRELGDLDGIGQAHRFIARAAARLGDCEEALAHARVSLWMAEEADRPFDRIFAMMTLCEIHWRQHNNSAATEMGLRAWKLAESQTAPVRARVANDLAWYLAQDGRYDQAWRMVEACLELLGPHGSALERASVLDTKGYICRRTGRLEQAVSYLTEAVDSMRLDPFSVADTLCTLAETYVELGRTREARTHLAEALDIYERQHRKPDIERARDLLARLELP
ncbi:BTAD domain-containing putative transcriptional regulator [Kutzneria sp. 744]|uniref:AfsR/SARP family transcriptional regulator n=1 Tax=Kutzneria sp. (strain 744) TaxID=345341 RepID=UPI0003EECEE2|nr:BTAD domain-containing putative transcriptional regulator [Kutzneria sp. 744]EWM17167.1 regulatory protein AfsR [Kutzneria sp. 744]